MALLSQKKDLVSGQLAPLFVLPDQSGTEHRLTDYRGFWVVLFFYPRDNTPGCTAEACQFRDDILAFRDLGVILLGLSLDSRERHARFADKFSLPYPLLSDVGGEVSRAYHTLFKVGAMKLAKRRTFVIAPDGSVAKMYRKVNPRQHSAELLADLETLISEKA